MGNGEAGLVNGIEAVGEDLSPKLEVEAVETPAARAQAQATTEEPVAPLDSAEGGDAAAAEAAKAGGTAAAEAAECRGAAAAGALEVEDVAGAMEIKNVAAAEATETAEAREVGDGAAVEAIEATRATEGKEEAAATPANGGVVKLGYKTFAMGKECRQYFNRLLHDLTAYQNLNEYEQNMVLALLRQGHPEPDRKIGAGVQAVQVKEVEMHGAVTRCFFVKRVDGTEDDFSTRKCLVRLFPDLETTSQPNHHGGGRGHGQRGREQGGSPGPRGRRRGPRHGRGRGRRGSGRGPSSHETDA